MKTVHVITIAREYGSGGAIIGRDLATRLRWRLLDRDLISEVARRAHIEPSAITEMDEHPSSFISNLLKTFWLGNYAWYGPTPEVVDADYLVQVSGIVIREAGKLGGCVIVGRGAQCVLRQQHDVFHAFVYASRHERLRRIRNQHRTEADAELALDETDRTRAAYIRTYYGCDWADRHLYDIMINSDIGPERVVSLILEAASLGAPASVAAESRT